MERRIAITGYGALCSLDTKADSLWEKVCQGQTSIKKIDSFDVSEFRTQIGGVIPSLEWLNVSQYIQQRDMKKLDNSSIYGLIAAQDALTMAAIPENYYDPYRCGTLVGSGIGGLLTLELQHKRLLASGPSKVSPFTIPKFIPNLICGNISINFKLRGPSFAAVSACSSGSHSIGCAMDYIRLNRCDMAVCGAAEAALTPVSYAGFCAMRAMTERNDDPAHASRPFDVQRDGFVMSEGAGILVLEEMECAKRRGAKIYAELVGYGASSDAEHITHPNANGEGGAKSMEMALREAKLNPEQIDYINVHGTSTPSGDVAEIKGIKSLFQDHAYKIPISSTKSEIGHLLGASGAVELIFCVKTIESGVVAPTINVFEQDPECDLNIVPNVAQEHKVDYALSNNFGFGGHNATLIVKRYQ